MERLAALCCLWRFGIGTKADYMIELNRLFLENSEDDFLLELEGLGDDSAAALTKLSPLVKGSSNVDVFGKELLSGLEKFYSKNCNSLSSLEEFGKMCYGMWKSFPANIDDQPFLTLAYADDPLSWGNEKQSRELYQAAFDYYKEKR